MMNFQKLKKRKLFLEKMLRAAESIPEVFPQRAELRGKILQAIALEKQGEHAKTDQMIDELDALAERVQKELIP